MESDLKLSLQHGVDHNCDGEIRLLRWRDMPKAMDAMLAAFEYDPLMRYRKDTPDAKNTRLFDWRRKLLYRCSIALAIIGKRGFTIHAEGFVTFVRATETRQGRRDLQMIRGCGYLINVGKIVLSKGQLKRQKEIDAKVAAVVDHTIGDRDCSIIKLWELFTAPEKQGRGYGTRLVKHITDMADAQSRAVSLLSSNIINTAFYESCGFSVVGEFTLGEKDPTWTKPPIVVRFMIREFAEPQCREKMPIL